MFPKLRAALIVFVSGALLFIFTLPARVQQSVPEKITSKASAQKPKKQKTPSADLIRRWQEFAAHTNARSVSWNPKTGTPEGIFGELSQASRKEPAAAARETARSSQHKRPPIRIGGLLCSSSAFSSHVSGNGRARHSRAAPHAECLTRRVGAGVSSVSPERPTLAQRVGSHRRAGRAPRATEPDLRGAPR